MRQITNALIAAFLILISATAGAGELFISNYTLVTRERVSRSVYDYTFRADVTNSNTYDVSNVTAALKDKALSSEVPDGELSFGDVPAGETVTSSDTFTVRVNRRFDFEASSLTWETDYSSDVPPELTLTMHEWVYLTAGKPEGISFTLKFRCYDTETYTIRISQIVETDTGGEISLDTDFPAEWTSDTTGTWILPETLTAHEPGMFGVMITTVSVAGTDVSEEAETVLKVEEEYEAPLLYPLSISPHAISVSERTDVEFWTELGMPDMRPSEIVLEETDGSGNPIRTLGQLADDGTSGDLRPDNGVYTGTFGIVSDTDVTFFFRAKATFPGVPEPVYTDLREFIVTRFPIGYVPPDISKIVTDPETGSRLLSNEVIVSFAKGTESDRIETIAGTVGGTVVSVNYGSYKIRFPGNGDVTGVYQVLSMLESFPEVETVSPNFIGGLSSYKPGDSSFRNGDQWASERIRADEAWIMARGGGIVVGVLDGGIYSDHPDLRENVIPRMNTEDNNGHGTAMAGIIAAVADNDTTDDMEENVIGIAWDSRILPLKAYDRNPDSLTNEGIELCINMAIDDKVIDGKKLIINMSLYTGYNTPTLKNTVLRAAKRNILLVASDAPGVPYPARYADPGEDAASEVLSVDFSATHETGGYDSYANIVAPGIDILTTMPRDDSAYLIDDPDSIYDHDYFTNYTYFSADSPSAATAVASGAAAVLWSAYPDWNAAQVKERLVRTGRLLSEPAVYRLTDAALARLREEGILKYPLTAEDEERTEKLYTSDYMTRNTRKIPVLSTALKMQN